MSHDEWYAQLKAATGRTLNVHYSDMSASLESALRRRARRDGFGLSVRLGVEAMIVSLFDKGTRGPGRQAYLRRVRSGR